jgi:hypothetical protein
MGQTRRGRERKREGECACSIGVGGNLFPCCGSWCYCWSHDCLSQVLVGEPVSWWPWFLAVSPSQKIIPEIPADLGLFSFMKINPESHQKILWGSSWPW